MNKGWVVGLGVVLLLAVLVMAAIVAGQSRRGSVSTPAHAGATNAARASGSAGVMTMSPVTRIRGVSPPAPSSAGPVAVHVQAAQSPGSRLSSAGSAPAAARAGAASRAPLDGASARPLATLQPQTLPQIVLARNGLPEGVPFAGEHDPIRIASVTLSADEVRGGDVASARVVTTSNAAALTARIGTYQVNVPRVAPGIFSIAITVPHLPLHDQSVDIIVTAIRSDGATAQTSVPLKVSF